MKRLPRCPACRAGLGRKARALLLRAMRRKDRHNTKTDMRKAAR